MNKILVLVDNLKKKKIFNDFCNTIYSYLSYEFNEFFTFDFFTDHWCTPADHIKPETLNISLEDWKQKFLPIELGPDYQPRASQCSMFEVTENEIPKFLSGEFPGNQSENLKKIDCRNNGGWTYDQR